MKMDIKEKIEETKKPTLWIQDYWNSWLNLGMEIYLAKNNGKDLPKDHKVETFAERFSKEKHFYYGQKLDISTIPKRFLHQNDRLVRVYNDLCSQASPDLDKLERVVEMARVLIYDNDWNK